MEFRKEDDIRYHIWQHLARGPLGFLITVFHALGANTPSSPNQNKQKHEKWRYMCVSEIRLNFRSKAISHVGSVSDLMSHYVYDIGAEASGNL